MTWRLTDDNDAHAVHQAFVGGRASTPVGVAKQETTFSWFKGDRSNWVKGAAAYGAVRYENVWPGIDVVYSGNASKVKYRFVVAPGADPSAIRMAYQGASTILTPSGDLRVTTPVNSFTDEAPYSYQGSKTVGSKTVASSYVLGAGGVYSFAVGNYNTAKPLVIDPAVIVYAGYIGGSGWGRAHGIAVDSSDAAYVTGRSYSTEDTFPIAGGPDLTHNGDIDAFVAKVAPSGASLSYAGYIGGSSDDYGEGIAVDSAGAAYVTGRSDSTQATFPVAGGPDLTHNGVDDAFVAKVAPSPSSTSLTIAAKARVAKGTTVAITGVLSSDEPACMNAQSLMLKKGTSMIGPKVTSAAGAYKFKTKITKKTVVQVTYAGTDACIASKSATKTINVV